MSSVRRAPLWAMVFTVSLASSCERPSPAPETGIDVDAMPRFVLEEQFRIGSVEGGDYAFTGLRSDALHVDHRGWIYVLDFDQTIKVFDEEGLFLRRIGRRGNGPGEFSGSVRFGVSGDTLWAWDGRLFDPGRWTYFGVDGTLLSTAPGVLYRATVDGACSQMVPGRRSPDGTFLGEVGFTTPGQPCPPGERVWGPSERPLVGFRGDGSVVDTLGTVPNLNTLSQPTVVRVAGGEWATPPHALATPMFEVLPDGRSYRVDRPLAQSGGPAVFRVSQFQLGGDTLLVQEFQYRPQSYPESLLDQLAARASRGATGSINTPDGLRLLRRDPTDSARARVAIREAMDFPQYQLPVRQLNLWDDGSLWILREDHGDDQLRWIVLDPQGLPRGELRYARGLEVRWSEGDRVVGVETDALGVPWVVVSHMVLVE